MLTMFEHLRDVSQGSVIVRMVLAMVCGGVIGIEREFKRRPAGFRTHILICLGAAMTTLISQFLFLELHYYTDMARLGAQVVAGVGFIGAGTIIVTRRQRVKGLTTAAGLWTSAIIGLALGAGFYEGGLIVTFLVLLAELVFSRLEYHILNSSREINLYLEYADKPCLDSVLTLFRSHNIKVQNMEITRSPGENNQNSCAIFSLRMNKQYPSATMLRDLSAMEGVVTVEEI